MKKYSLKDGKRLFFSIWLVATLLWWTMVQVNREWDPEVGWFFHVLISLGQLLVIAWICSWGPRYAYKAMKGKSADRKP